MSGNNAKMILKQGTIDFFLGLLLHQHREEKEGEGETKNEGIICEGGNGGRQEAGKTHPTSHPRSASIQGSGIDEGEKPWRIKLSW